MTREESARRAYEERALARRKVDALERIAAATEKIAGLAAPKPGPSPVTVTVREEGDEDREPPLRPPVEPMGVGD